MQPRGHWTELWVFGAERQRVLAGEPSKDWITAKLRGQDLICLDFYPEDGWGDRLGERVGASKECWWDSGWEMVGWRPGE